VFLLVLKKVCRSVEMRFSSFSNKAEVKVILVATTETKAISALILT
jgi:hypothetical protein